MIKRFLLILLLALQALLSKANDSTQRAEWKGYVSDMASGMFQDISFRNPDGTTTNLGEEWYYNQLHNRLDLVYPLNSHFQFSFGLRTRILAGKLPLQGNNDDFHYTSGYTWYNQDLYVNTMMDRAYLQYTLNKLVITAGRQRVNWGQCLVWNPNDLFNAYSFFDFDYPERPGSDALRVQYYTGMASTLEFASKIDSSGRTTSALLYRFNKWNFDIQFLGGIYEEKDITGGAGFSGNLSSLGIRGEGTYFHPIEASDSNEAFNFSLSAEYLFSNSFMIQLNFLYQSMQHNTMSFTNLYSLDLSARQLSFVKYNYFLQLSYPLTPLLSSSLSAIYYPGLNGFYAGPAFDLSTGDNSSFSFNSQYFYLKEKNSVDISLFMIYLRYKWSF